MPLNLKFKVQQDDKRLFNSRTISYVAPIYQGKNNLLQSNSSASRRGLIHVSIDELFPIKEQQKKERLFMMKRPYRKTCLLPLMIGTKKKSSTKVLHQQQPWRIRL